MTIRRGGLRSEGCTAWERCDSENPGRGDASQGLFARDRPDSRKDYCRNEGGAFIECSDTGEIGSRGCLIFPCRRLNMIASVSRGKEKSQEG